MYAVPTLCNKSLQFQDQDTIFGTQEDPTFTIEELMMDLGMWGMTGADGFLRDLTTINLYSTLAQT